MSATAKPIPHGTVSGYNHYACRCDECRAAKAAWQRANGGNRRVGARAEVKRRWDREHRPLCECGQPMGRGAERCCDCQRADKAAYRRLVEDMWAEGMTARQIAGALGWKCANPNQYIVVLRNRQGYNLPHRRTPEQIARITAGSGESLARARAVQWAQRMAAR